MQKQFKKINYKISKIGKTKLTKKKIWNSEKKNLISVNELKEKKL